MDFEGMTDQQKIEYTGWMHFNRIGEEGWHLQEDFITSKDGLVNVHLDNDQNNEIEEY